MSIRMLYALAIGLLLGSTAAQAVPVLSTTTTQLMMRNCITGATACDSIGPVQVSEVDGSPGDTSAAKTLTDASYGSLRGCAQITGSGDSVTTSGATNTAGKRNGANSGLLQRYIYTGAAGTATRSPLSLATLTLTASRVVPLTLLRSTP